MAERDVSVPEPALVERTTRRPSRDRARPDGFSASRARSLEVCLNHDGPFIDACSSEQTPRRGRAGEATCPARHDGSRHRRPRLKTRAPAGLKTRSHVQQRAT